MTTWKQVVYDVADAYREADGSTAKIPVGQLADKVREGAGIPYTGDNPLTIGQNGYIFEPKTLLKNGLTIVNGVNGEDLTDVEARQALAVADLMSMVKRKVSESKNNGLYVWERYTAEGGDFLDYVVADVEDAYPNGEMLDGYYYKTVEAEGLYVWKKYIQNGTAALDFSIVEKSPLVLTVSSNEVDLSTVTNEFFAGCSGTYTITTGTKNYEFGANTLTMDGVAYDFTYDPSTKQISSNGGNTFLRNWSSTTANIPPTLVDYVVSDDANAYPDGGTQEGYWYERVEGYSADEVLTPEMFGCTKMAVDTFTYSSRKVASSVTQTHTLGKTPKMAIVMAEEVSANNDLYVFFTSNPLQASGTRDNSTLASHKTNTYASCSAFKSTLTETAYNVVGATSVYFQAGVEYTLITMA